jgi:arylsulfatase A-like enzyme
MMAHQLRKDPVTLCGKDVRPSCEGLHRPMTRRTFLSALLLLWSIVPSFASARPNIVFILADDLGYGDLACYGATDIRTPNIDHLAEEGIRFTNYYSAANTCSPSRAALMTGRYPPRTGVNGVLSYDTVDGLPLEEITLAEMLKDTGYTTGMIGKWHLGQVEALMPWRQGFDSFFGTATSNDDENFFLYESTGTQYRRIPERIDQTRLIRQYTEHALQFLKQHARESNPFFLYLAHNAPHVPLHPSQRFVGSSRRGIYGDVVQELDDSVGQLLDTLRVLHLDDNTLVVFSSDNGGWRTMRDLGGSNGQLREGKLTTFEGGHRVPALARWPAHAAAGAVNTRLTTMMDWFPTFAHLAGARLPEDRIIDGRDLTAVLDGSSRREVTPFFYFALRPPHEDQHYLLAGVREGQWKYLKAQRGYYPQFLEPLMKVGLYSHGELLFDLEKDPGEQHNVIDEHRDVAQHLSQVMQEFIANNPMPEPVNVLAMKADNAGWHVLWVGISEAVLLVLGSAALLFWAVIRLIRHYRSTFSRISASLVRRH